ncbi:MAG: CHC2 zinc finger domain-containing protein [Gammaproteobacteria bacterium]|jgi:DNA primase
MIQNPIDFAAIKGRVRFEAVLTTYGIALRGQGAERMIRCPFHDDASPSCAVNLDRKLFHCFACGAKGTVLDFVAEMEQCSIPEAARLLSQRQAVPGTSVASRVDGGVRRKPPAENRPLAFALALDPDHPYLAERGVTQATVARFGLGYCNRGIMTGRICIPLHDTEGRLVAYLGRWAEASPLPGVTRYRFPPGLRKNLVLFNWHRVKKATHLVIVEGCWSVFRLDALGIAAVALMGRTLSGEQERIIRDSPVSRVTLLLDGDQPGRAATAEILAHLARHLFVRAPDLPEAAEPDTMDEKALIALANGKAD